MSVLVIAEHDNAELKPATLNTVTAAKKLGDVTVLVAGSGCAAVGDAAATVAGVAKVDDRQQPRLGAVLVVVQVRVVRLEEAALPPPVPVAVLRPAAAPPAASQPVATPPRAAPPEPAPPGARPP